METIVVLASDFSGLAFDNLFRYGLYYGLPALALLVGAVWLAAKLMRRK